MKVYPHILLRKGDKIKPWGDEKMWHVVDLIDWNLIATDGVHIFSPPWGFYLKEGDYYIPITLGSFVVKIKKRHARGCPLSITHQCIEFYNSTHKWNVRAVGILAPPTSRGYNNDLLHKVNTYFKQN